jgi:hypothetical protein
MMILEAMPPDGAVGGGACCLCAHTADGPPPTVAMYLQPG